MCCAAVPRTAKMCAYCGFELWAFDENRKSARCLKMEKVPRGTLSPKEVLRNHYSKEGGGRSLALGLWIVIPVMLALSLFIWPILLITIPVAFILFVMSLVVLIHPGWGHYQLKSAENWEKHQECLQQTEAGLDHCYRGVHCLSCGRVEGDEVMWYSEGGSWDCPSCRARHYRDGDYLFVLPHPFDVPGGKLKEHFLHAKPPG